MESYDDIGTQAGTSEVSRDKYKNRLCTYCHETKPILTHKHQCDECSLIKYDIVLEKKRNRAREIARKHKETQPKIEKEKRPCVKCNIEMIESPYIYCCKCKTEIQEARKVKANEVSKKRYHDIKKKIIEEEQRQEEIIYKNIEEKFEKKLENLTKTELIQMIIEHYEKMVDVEDIRNEVKWLLPRSQ